MLLRSVAESCGVLREKLRTDRGDMFDVRVRSVTDMRVSVAPCLRQTDRPTDHDTRSVTVCRIYVRSTAMRPNNNNVYTWKAPLIRNVTEKRCGRWSN